MNFCKTPAIALRRSDYRDSSQIEIFMKRLLLVFFTLVAFVFLGTKISYAKWVWSKETNWVNPDQLLRETADQQFRYAITLIVNREYISAIGIFEDIIKKKSRIRACRGVSVEHRQVILSGRRL